jgi:hypothetical protein
MVYPGSGPYMEVIALHLRFDIEDKQWLQWGEKRAQEVCKVNGEMISYPLLEVSGDFYRPSSGRITTN